MLLFDLTPDLSASEGHKSHMDSGNIRLELKFRMALPDSNACLVYLEYDNSIRVDFFQNSRPTFEDGLCADTVYPAKCEIFLGVYTSDLLPH